MTVEERARKLLEVWGAQTDREWPWEDMTDHAKFAWVSLARYVEAEILRARKQDAKVWRRRIEAQDQLLAMYRLGVAKESVLQFLEKTEKERG